MKIFLDSADIEEIKEAVSTGVVDGVTTNPSLIKKAQEKYHMEDMQKYITSILKTVSGPVSLEVTETNYEDMLREARQLDKLFGKYKNLVVKIPVNPSNDFDAMENFDGFRVIKELSDDGISVNTTVVFTPEQAVLAAKAGAKYVSPFAGRVDDYIRDVELGKKRGVDFDKWDYYPAEGVPKNDGSMAEDNGIYSGVDLVSLTAEIFDRYDFKCKILAASARNARQVRQFMLAGADVSTLPMNVLKELTSHYKTTEGVISFSRDTVPEYRELLEESKLFSFNFSKE